MEQFASCYKWRYCVPGVLRIRFMELYIDFIYLFTQILQVTFKQGQGPFSISAHTLVPFPGLVPCMHIYPSHIAPQVTQKVYNIQHSSPRCSLQLEHITSRNKEYKMIGLQCSTV